MKRTGRAFAALVILALAAFIAGNAFLAAQMDNYTVTGEVLFGERGDAEGVTVHLKTAFQNHLFWDAVYDAGAGVSEENAEWGRRLGTGAVRMYEPDEVYLKALDAGGHIEWTSDQSRSSAFSGAEQLEPIAAELEERSGPYGQMMQGVYPLADFYEYVPLSFNFGDLEADGGVGPEEVFRVGAVDGMKLNALLTHSGKTSALSTGLSNGVVRSDSAFDGEYIYFVMNVREGPDALGDGGGLPGGGWGVYRIPCDGESADFAAAENIYMLPGGWQDAKVELMGDTLCVMALIDGGVKLTLLDTRTLETVQSLDVFSPEQLTSAGYGDGAVDSLDYVNLSVSGGGFAVTLGNLAAAYAFDGGRCAEIYTGLTAFDLRPGRYDAAWFYGYGWEPVDAKCDGERLIVLREMTLAVPEGDPDSEDDDISVRSYALLLFGQSGLEYAEWLNIPLEHYYYSGYYLYTGGSVELE